MCGCPAECKGFSELIGHAIRFCHVSGLPSCGFVDPLAGMVIGGFSPNQICELFAH